MAEEKTLTELAAEIADGFEEPILARKFKAVVAEAERNLAGEHPSRAAAAAGAIRNAGVRIKELRERFELQSADREINALAHTLRTIAITRTSAEPLPDHELNQRIAAAGRALRPEQGPAWTSLETDLLLALLKPSERLTSISAVGVVTNQRTLTRQSIREMGMPSAYQGEARFGWLRQFPSLAPVRTISEADR
jgi:hypothetical protein